MTNSIQSFVQDPHFYQYNEETFILRFSSRYGAFASDVLEILKEMLPWHDVHNV